MARKIPYPFVKWVGGKSRMAHHVLNRLPGHVRTYYEPCLGGGAVLLELAKAGRFERAVASDLNPEIANAWTVVKNDPEALISELSSGRYVYDRARYEEVRSDRPDTSLTRAARFIYLNRTCFNGLYRVNRLGEFNVPFGRYKDPVICDPENIRAVSSLLRDVKIVLAGLAQGPHVKAGKGDAVYFDPPYAPKSRTSSFTSYTSEGFGEAQHRVLAEQFRSLGAAGARVVLSNSDVPLVHELYSSFDMDRLTGSRSVGGPASYRKPAGEVLVFHGPKA
jgi:DNA adenine methylase